MIKSISNPIEATWIFSIILIIALLATARRKKDNDFFSLALTQELKGLAILAVVFSHFGYFLTSDNHFLFPLSTLAGVGVNLFLLLSGLGLVTSALKKPLPIFQFYKKRLLKLFAPLWITLIVFLTLDYFVLHLTYSWPVVLQAFLGIFRHANLYTDINSPLWYFTLILFYYLIFPLVFSKKYPWLSALIIYFVPYFILRENPGWLINVLGMYQVHLMAFPLGMIFGWLFYNPGCLARLPWFKVIAEKLKCQNKFAKLVKNIKPASYYFLMISLIVFIMHFVCYSGVGEGLDKEQWISIITVLAIMFLFIIKKIEFKLFYWFGVYSYEIYLIHWPLAYRYDVFYKYLPAWLATVFCLAFVWFLSKGLNKLSKIILSKTVKLN
ncbi:MAG: acyltransferase family protein [Patescibacteria group bacterium]|nr:acyltransferase family protein [Patescibacteria group bacterium]MDD4610355.1 acyltransferase family protein [Patescibacteria group bacterium]